MSVRRILAIAVLAAVALAGCASHRQRAATPCEQAKWQAVARAGAGMMASPSPYPGVAMGQGLQQGLAAMPACR